MVTQELIDYVRESLKRGAFPEEIKQKLKLYNWTDEEINSAFNLVQLKTDSIGIVDKSEEVKNTGKVIKLFLIISIFAIVIIIFGFITYFVLSINSSESEGGAIGSQEKGVKCEIDSDCEAGFKCIDKMCKTSSGSISPENPSPTSTRRRQVGGSEESTPTPTPETNARSLDCGKNLDCFISNAETCNLAKVIYNYETKLFGIWSKSNTMYYELKGIESEKCLFYLKQEEKDGICKISTKELVETLKVWKEDGLQVGTFSDEVWKNSKCEGSYFS